jgi:retron-type reverse transcriptase
MRTSLEARAVSGQTGAPEAYTEGGGKTRPLGIPVLEDKLLQLAASRVLTAIYEQDFLPASRGYGPGSGALGASRDLAGKLGSGRYAWFVDADIRGFFEHVEHGWMIRMLKQRVDDRAFLRLIGKWLLAGVLEEDGKVLHPTTGGIGVRPEWRLVKP